MPRAQYDSRVDRKPFMDKISNNIHMPAPKINYRDDEHSAAHGYNSTTVFPSLKHTGLKSNYEPEEAPSNSPDGRMTSSFKNVSIDLMRKIYRDEIALNSRESQFKLSHRKEIQNQFQSYNTQSLQRLRKLNTIRNDYTQKLSSPSLCSDFQQAPTSLRESSSYDLNSLGTDREKKQKEKKRCANRLAYFNQLLESS